MIQIIAIIVVVLIVGFALKGALKHIKGEGDCCGGGSAPLVVDKKLSGKILSTRILKIEGMHCDKCKSRVHAALNEIEGVRATVSLNREEATVETDRDVNDEVLISAVEKAGYQVSHIQDETSV